jgi:hypothetical protein
MTVTVEDSVITFGKHRGKLFSQVGLSLNRFSAQTMDFWKTITRIIMYISLFFERYCFFVFSHFFHIKVTEFVFLVSSFSIFSCSFTQSQSYSCFVILNFNLPCVVELI